MMTPRPVRHRPWWIQGVHYAPVVDDKWFQLVYQTTSPQHTLEKYQIPINIPMRLSLKQEKCYYEGVEDVDVYEQMLKVGLRFPLSALHRRFLQYLGRAVT